jgi:hypothetical protein
MILDIYFVLIEVPLSDKTYNSMEILRSNKKTNEEQMRIQTVIEF